MCVITNTIPIPLLYIGWPTSSTTPSLISTAQLPHLLLIVSSASCSIQFTLPDSVCCCTSCTLSALLLSPALRYAQPALDCSPLVSLGCFTTAVALPDSSLSCLLCVFCFFVLNNEMIYPIKSIHFTNINVSKYIVALLFHCGIHGGTQIHLQTEFWRPSMTFSFVLVLSFSSFLVSDKTSTPLPQMVEHAQSSYHRQTASLQHMWSFFTSSSARARIVASNFKGNFPHRLG